MRKRDGHIHKNTQDYYRFHKDKCAFHNWTARLIAYLEFGKRVWPVPGEKEIEAFKRVTGWKTKKKGSFTK